MRKNDYSKVFDTEEDGKLELKRFFGFNELYAYYFEIDARHGNDLELVKNLMSRQFDFERGYFKQCYWRLVEVNPF